MFRNRKTSRKPTDALYANFRGVFSQAVSASTFKATRPSGSSLNDGLNEIFWGTQSDTHRGHERREDEDFVAGAFHEQWGPQSSSFSSSVKSVRQDLEYLPSALGVDRMLHNDHFGIHQISENEASTNIIVPLSPLAPEDKNNYRKINNCNPFDHLELSLPDQFSYFATDFAPMGDPEASFVTDSRSMDTEMCDETPLTTFSSQSPRTETPTTSLLYSESSRFQVTLDAPTSVINQSDGIPLTYMDKGKAYSISVIDKAPQPQQPRTTIYRTAIRIFFKDGQQRKTPTRYWQLWKEGNETSRDPEKRENLQAVEYIKLRPSTSTAVGNRTSISELCTSSVDGFSVLWTAGMEDNVKCNIALKLNFLSTDFSMSKGIEGSICRLCVKTEVLSSNLVYRPPEIPEICFCELKLFRHHGTDRKLKNDHTHVKNAIDKLTRQIAMTENELGDRKQTKPRTKSVSWKVTKRQEIFVKSCTESRNDAREDLFIELRRLQDKIARGKSATTFTLRGRADDDPDLHLVSLNQQLPNFAKVQLRGQTVWQQEAENWNLSASEIEPLSSPSSLSPPSKPSNSKGQGNSTDGVNPFAAPPGAITLNGRNEFQPMVPQPAGLQQSSFQYSEGSLSNQPTRVPQLQQDNTLAQTNWIDVIGIDPSYTPPLEQPAKPVACFYIQHRELRCPPGRKYYRAVYLMKGGVQDLIASLAAKFSIKPSTILQVTHVDKNGLRINIDDEVVRQIPENQRITLEFSNVIRSIQKPECDRTDTNPDCESQELDLERIIVESLDCELRLIF